jgi:hypothetical protein
MTRKASLRAYPRLLPPERDRDAARVRWRTIAKTMTVRDSPDNGARIDEARGRRTMTLPLPFRRAGVWLQRSLFFEYV